MNRAFLRAAAMAFAAFLALPASAQWAWRDTNGRVVYSDRAPPSSVKPQDIIRQPGSQSMIAPAPSNSPAPAPAASGDATKAADGKGAAPSGPKTLAERDMEFRKRQQERAEAEKKQQEEQATASQRAQECERMRGYLRALEDGVRISRTDAQGNREVLEDAQRSAEIARVREQVGNVCK